MPDHQRTTPISQSLCSQRHAKHNTFKLVRETNTLRFRLSAFCRRSKFLIGCIKFAHRPSTDILQINFSDFDSLCAAATLISLSMPQGSRTVVCHPYLSPTHPFGLCTPFKSKPSWTDCYQRSKVNCNLATLLPRLIGRFDILIIDFIGMAYVFRRRGLYFLAHQTIQKKLTTRKTSTKKMKMRSKKKLFEKLFSRRFCSVHFFLLHLLFHNVIPLGSKIKEIHESSWECQWHRTKCLNK